MDIEDSQKKKRKTKPDKQATKVYLPNRLSSPEVKRGVDFGNSKILSKPLPRAREQTFTVVAYRFALSIRACVT